MADKQISELTPASALSDGTLFVAEQSGVAKSVTFRLFKSYISPDNAPLFSTETSYVVNDYVIYDTYLYRFTAAKAPGAWDSSKAVQTTVGAELKALHSPSAIAPIYSSSSAYSVGSYTFHDGILYRCTTAITTAETWTAAHWTAAVIGDDVSENKRASIHADNILVSSTNLSSYNDVDTYPMNTVVCVLPAVASQVSHAPFDDGFTIISTGFHKGPVNSLPYGGEVQVAIPTFTEKYGIKYRTYDGESFTPWIDANGQNVFFANSSNFVDVIDKALNFRDSTVYLLPTTYTMFNSTRTEAYWKNRRPATRYCGINLYNGIKIIGLGSQAVITAYYTGGDEDIRENFSVFNIAGDCRIENVRIEGSGICYLIHDDPMVVNVEYSNCQIVNCMLLHEGSDHVFVSGAPTCIGAGETLSTIRTIEGNYFRAIDFDYPLAIHSMTNGRGRYLIRDNVFMSGTIKFSSFGTGGQIRAITSGNHLQAAIDTTGMSSGLDLQSSDLSPYQYSETVTSFQTNSTLGYFHAFTGLLQNQGIDPYKVISVYTDWDTGHNVVTGYVVHGSEGALYVTFKNDTACKVYITYLK